jgi:hypothetical protein
MSFQDEWDALSAQLTPENAADIVPRLAALITAYHATNLTRLVALLQAREEDAAAQPVAYVPTKIDSAWQAALTDAQRTASACPLAWAHIRARLGASFPSGIRSTELAQADKDAGTHVLRVLCGAAAQLEPTLRRNGTKGLTEASWLLRYPEQRHPPKPIPLAEKHSAALAAARRTTLDGGAFTAFEGAFIALERAISAAGALFS